VTPFDVANLVGLYLLIRLIMFLGKITNKKRKGFNQATYVRIKPIKLDTTNVSIKKELDKI